MDDVSFSVATPYVSARPGRGAGPTPQAGQAAAARVEARPAESDNSSDISNKSKVKTDFRSAHAFTYTFFDAKTLEVLAKWPEAPVYRLQGAHVPLGAAVETVI